MWRPITTNNPLHETISLETFAKEAGGEMKDSYRKKRTLWAWVGIGTLWINYLFVETWDLYLILWIFGLFALVYGSYCWAKYKGRSGWFALLGIVAPIGFIPLAVMKDKYIRPTQEEAGATTKEEK